MIDLNDYTLTETITHWLEENTRPEQVFTDQALTEWATRNGFERTPKAKLRLISRVKATQLLDWLYTLVDPKHQPLFILDNSVSTELTALLLQYLFSNENFYQEAKEKYISLSDAALRAASSAASNEQSETDG